MKLLTCDHCSLDIEEKDLTILGDIPFHKVCYPNSDLYRSIEEYFNNEKTKRENLLAMQGTN